MLAKLIEPDALVLIAGLFYAVGYLIINQVILRIMIMIGTGLYLAYYFTVSSEPLWAAIYMSLAIGTANLIGMASLLAGRSRLAIPRAHRDLFSNFMGMQPGDFRALMKTANRRILTEELQATTEGAPGDTLYYVIKGNCRIEKRSEVFVVPPGVFVGEVAYLTGQRSSASTWLPAGSEILEWKFETLRRHSTRRSRFKLALEASISLDLAAKVSYAVAPRSDEWRPRLEVVHPSS